jgi:hypothetical protein
LVGWKLDLQRLDRVSQVGNLTYKDGWVWQVGNLTYNVLSYIGRCKSKLIEVRVDGCDDRKMDDKINKELRAMV